MSLRATVSGVRQLEPRQVFQALSYLQYPAMLAGLAIAARPLFNGMDGMLEAYNSALLYLGVGVGLSSLQDPGKTQNEMSRRVWEDPRKGYLMLWVLALSALLPIVLGLLGTALASSTALSQLSWGFVAYGLGMLGLLKTAIEMRERHRLDKRAIAGAATNMEGNA